MQDEQQFEQLILQYNQIKNSSDEISRMIDNEDFDNAITMIKNREQIFLSCKCMRKYLELTPVQEKELDALLDEIREKELVNMKKIETGKEEVLRELKKSQQSNKIQKAYDVENKASGNIVNIEE